ncbi:dual specificity protein phosphatase 13-like [Ceraceosorus bombacis]|uniref:Dual specificity protein phosphatase 13-like n=1 Tax=Ceraceosorus bombacis TaxID=401625 RepID=A0A0P1BPG1_9BASI|nr:dual specificity protein phosphatase 13-like [Ceraceosorus bombacis]
MVQKGPTRVAANLWLAGLDQLRSASQLEQLGISHIVNATREHADVFPEEGFVRVRIAASDNAQERLSPHFERIAELIRQARDAEGAQVLIHCHEGISRSATLALAAVLILDGKGLSEAIEQMRRCRAPVEVEPNPSFLHELRQLELRLFGRFTANKLTRLDDCRSPIAEHSVREDIARLLARAASDPTAIEGLFPEADHIALQLASSFERDQTFERDALCMLEQYAVGFKPQHEAAAKVLLQILLSLSKELGCGGTALVLGRLQQWLRVNQLELRMDAPQALKHANAIMQALAAAETDKMK